MEEELVDLVLKGPAEMKSLGWRGELYLFVKGVPQRAPRSLAEALVRNCTAEDGRILEMDFWEIAESEGTGGEV
jgi:hypothetical protein